MRKSIFSIGAVTAAVFVAAVAASGQNTVQDQPEGQPMRTATFMRLKLDRAKDLLEGIALEDYDQIARSSQAISLLTHDENWQVVRSVDYVRLSEQFRRSADDVTKAAADHNLEAATLSYMQMTMNCVACHKYMRSDRTAEPATNSSP